MPEEFEYRKSTGSLDPFWFEHGYGTGYHGFQNLMQQRIREVMLVSSPYDLYLFEEDGRLYDLIRNEYQGLHLSHSPEITRVSSGEEALALATQDTHFDLIITTLHIEDLTAVRLARSIKDIRPEVPIVLLAYDRRELGELMMHYDTSVFDRIFIWQGDFRLIIAIIKHLEDLINVDSDTATVGVQAIILVEDNVGFYSSYLPLIYTEILKQSRRLITEGINLTHRYLRMRARPKILLCTNHEEALDNLNKYQEYILGVISDVDFKRDGTRDSRAGLDFAREIKSRHADIPVLLQSNNKNCEQEAREIGATFVVKDSPTLLFELRQFMTQYFSFGDFVFRLPDGSEVGRAYDLRTLEEQLKIVPEESVRFHAERNHFSNWLKARTEFWLAHQLRPRMVSHYPTVNDLRKDLIRSLKDYRRQRQRGQITDFSRETFDPNWSFARVGGGSLGGKARGLGFVNILINNLNVKDRFAGVHLFVPSAIVLGTDVFDEFLDDNNLRTFALNCTDIKEIRSRFLDAGKFPESILQALRDFLDIARFPLAVRSSSLLEDSQYHPFAGVYETHMIPNNNPESAVRLQELVNTIKLIYASTFSQGARDYMRATAYRLEEEKMAIIIQRMIGSRFSNRFYPDFAGVAKSYNFYPVAPQKPSDGIAAVALGLGKTIVDGGISLRFCPKYPAHLLQFFSPAEALRNNQTEFYALEMDGESPNFKDSELLFMRKYGLNIAELDGTLHVVGSTYSPENDRLYPGISRPGVRIVTFDAILQSKVFPLAEILEFLQEMGTWGMGAPVELEFAVNLSHPADERKEFALLQMRPLALSRETDELEIGAYEPKDLLCQSSHVLGNGVIDEIRDIIYVPAEQFDRSRTRDVAREVFELNEKLLDERRPYLLIGVGRWGSLDPWLGIPVKWEHICGARAIVEAGFKDTDVEPSQGSHFFQNITSFSIGYFSIRSRNEDDWIDWDWLARQPRIESRNFTHHIRFDSRIVIKMNGRLNRGVILKPA